MSRRGSLRDWLPVAAALERQIERDEAAWLAAALKTLPARWADLVRKEHKRRGGLKAAAANLYVTQVTAAACGRVPLSASDGDLRVVAQTVAREARELIARGGADAPIRHVKEVDVLGLKKTLAGGSGEDAVAMQAKLDALAASFAGGVSVRSIEAMATAARGWGKGAALAALEELCRSWDIEPAGVGASCDVLPAIRRMCCERWWLRRLRRAHGKRCEGAAIKAGVVRRGLWVYATQDAVERRQAQRARNAAAIDKASVFCVETGEDIDLAGVVAASVANPEVKRAELMTRIKGCDAIAAERGYSCEFWTLTTPSRMHAQKIEAGQAVANSHYDNVTPKEAQVYLSKVWARARAAWKRRGLDVFGLRTAEPHHDGTPHWHLIVYGKRRDLRFARRLMRVYALRDSPNEDGARVHRFKVLEARAGTRGAAYAAKYVSKNIDGKGLEGQLDAEGEKKISASVRRVDAWAAAWGIRQFQFFGCPAITAWRVLRRMRSPVAVPGSALERARVAADGGDFAEFWRACCAGSIAICYREGKKETVYGDAAAPKVAGVFEGGRRAELPDKTWVISWAGVKNRVNDVLLQVFSAIDRGKNRGSGDVFGFSRSCVNNCTEAENFSAGVLDRWEESPGMTLW